MAKLPVYEILIDDSPESGFEVDYVALVGAPAIEKNFMVFNENTPIKIDFTADIDRKIISGPAMLPDTLIYRKDADTGEEYNVFFSKETVESIALKFFKNQYQKNLNLFHDPNLSLEGVTIFESFISDKARGVAPMKGYESLPDGSWFISVKVENEDVWNSIKEGKVKGFSVEGQFGLKKKEEDDPTQKFISALVPKMTNEQIKNISHKSPSIMSAIKNLLAEFRKQLFEDTPADPPAAPAATTYKLKDGKEVSISAMEVGGTVLSGDAPAAAGDYELEDGTKITVGESGIITAIVPVVADPAMTPEQQMQAVKEAAEKFAVGTPEERMTRLETVAKALMEYCYGWDLRRAEEEAKKQAAIEVYRTGLESQKTELQKQLDDLTEKNKKQAEQITQMFEMIQKIAEEPTAEEVGEVKTSFMSAKIDSKKESRQRLLEAIKGRNKN